jgi:toxin secretion/phage lysis holin
LDKLKYLYGGIASFFAYIFGGMDSLMAVLLILIVIDFISGFIKAWMIKEFTSNKFYIGGVKKLGILLIVAVSTQLDTLMVGETVIFRVAAITYYIANEGFSILENWGALGLPLPKQLKDALAKLKEDNSDDNK